MGSKLNSVLDAWKTFNIQETQNVLDQTASEITSRQDEAESSRKKLVEQLKEYKTSASDESRHQAAVIIRSFQNEVDSLNKRSKFAETAFLKSYQKFLDIIDPVASLEYCLLAQKKVEKFEDLQIECQTLRQTMNEYKEEFKDMRNQDITIKNLKEKLRKYEYEMEQSIEKKVNEVERNLINEYNEKEQLLTDNHNHTLKKLDEAEVQQKILEQNLEQMQSELFEFKSKQEESTSAKTESMDILMNDLDRSNLLIMSLQKEASRMCQETNNQSNTIDAKGSSLNQLELLSLESEVKTKNREISQLIVDVQHLQLKLKETEDSSSKIIVELSNALRKSEEVVSVQNKMVEQQKDYDEIRHELSVIKSVEFSSSDLTSSNDEAKHISKPLEVLLLEKNKSLQNLNTNLKVKSNSLAETIGRLENQLSQLQVQNDNQGKLIAQLESDVLSVQTRRTNYSEEEPSQMSLLSAAVGEIDQQLSDNSIGQAIDGTDSSSSESVLTIVAAQRERFRLRNDELEVDVASKNNTIMLLQAEIETLRADNIKLYEKIKFLQSFDHKKSGSDASVSRYSREYENTLDPFSSFSQKEKQRKYASLSPFEKMTLFFGKFIIQSKTARTAAVFYITLIHCLIFFVLFVLAQTESCKREISSNCGKMFCGSHA